MSDKKRLSQREIARKVLLVLMLCAVVAVELWYRLCDSPTEDITALYSSLSRFFGGMVALIFMLEFSFGKILHPLGNRRWRALVFIIPALAVAVNNFPWVSFLAGDCTFGGTAGEILFYAFSCLCVGLFEELAFRGCALMLLLKSRTKTKLKIFMAIFWSSVVFGAVHLVNIFTASPGAVILQIGYSALIGALCCTVLLETGNMWLCVFTHALYNFAGGVIPAFGEGTIWTAPEIAITAVVGVAVAIYSVIRFIKMPTERAEELFLNKEQIINN
jgi:hypothetical protein